MKLHHVRQEKWNIQSIPQVILAINQIDSPKIL